MKSDRIVMLRIVVLMIGVCLFFVGLAGRLYYLQIIIAPKIVKSSGSQSIYKRFLYATRGHIFDRNGRALALHEKKYNIIANKIIGNKIIIKNITETVWQVGTILKDDPEFKMDPTAIQKHVRALQREKIKSREILRNLSEAQKDLGNWRGIYWVLPGPIIKD